MAMSRGIFVYFNSPQPIELHGTHSSPRAALSQEAGAEASEHMAVLELPYARRRELVPRDAWQHPSCPEPRLWG
jgi:hypothetical protein